MIAEWALSGKVASMEMVIRVELGPVGRDVRDVLAKGLRTAAI